ncbi:hypothetical protein N7456_010807 [Penicillium angulare]|uniref:MARVEL domain-containing protein n=1 Tax=Penicillium angulare TaxID=116970 RepID=A0A9W9ESS2_9EURO|nr:hypothetical protein N7456_010807 [Penicillium angulare]
MRFSRKIARPLQLVTRTLQWSSAVIVMGLSSYFIMKGPHGQHILYQDVIAVLSVVCFLPAFISPFFPTSLSKFVLLIDVIFSYLWLTSFIFAAQDYDRHSCYSHAPPGVTCGRKKANQTFIFLAFVFTFFGMFLEVASLWAYRKENPTQTVTEKHDGTRPPLDAPAEVPAPVAEA